MKTDLKYSHAVKQFTKQTTNSLGFSLAELAVTAVILGILASLALAYTSYEIERAKVNTIQSSIAGWLQVVQRSALEKKSSTILGAGCEVTFEELTSQPGGSILASVIPGSCGASANLIIDPGNVGNSKVSASFSQEKIIFTPRGTVIYPGSSSQQPKFEYNVILNGSKRLRCVRLSGLAGVIELGSKSGSSSSTELCTNYSSL